jgi:hypothetical protein
MGRERHALSWFGRGPAASPNAAMLATFVARVHPPPVRRFAVAIFVPLMLGGCLSPAASHTAPRLAPVIPREPLPSLDIARPDHGELDATNEDSPLAVGLRSAVIQTGAKSVGSTSVVFKVPLDGGIAAAFKPETRKHGTRWRSEVAAYRLSRALGLDNVPVAVPRAAKMASLLASTRSAVMVRLLRDQCLQTDDGRVRGAMIAWIPGLARMPLENDPLWSAWGEWLRVASPKRSIELRVALAAAKKIRDARVLASQLSSLIVFDHVIGNRDRWSGHNVLVDVTRTRLVYLDHNLAFDAKLDIAATAKRTMVLARVERFSAALIGRLRKLTRAELVAALGTDEEGAPLLDAPQIDATIARRDELIARVDELIVRFGEAKVLSFD